MRQVEALGFSLLFGVYFLLAVAYGMATPDLEAPDAGAHFRYVAYLHDHPQMPGYDLPTALVSHELVQQPLLYYAMVTALLPGSDVKATVAYEQAVQTPYFEKGLGKRATVSPAVAAPDIVWPLRVAVRRQPGRWSADGRGNLGAGAHPAARPSCAAVRHYRRSCV